MVRATFLCLVAAVAAVASQTPQKPDVVVDRAYSGDGIKLEGVGVCDISASSIRCWDMNGAPNPDIEKMVGAYLTTQNSGQIQFRYGQKNRWLVLRHSGSHPGFYETGSGSSRSSFQVGDGGDGSLDVVSAIVDPKETSTDVIAALFGLPGPPPADFAWKEGKLVYAGATFDIGRPKEVKKPQSGGNGFGYGWQFQYGKHWQVPIGMERTAESQRLSLSLTAMGTDGSPIRYVDLQGEPVPPVRVLSEDPNFQNGYPGNYPGAPKPKFLSAMIAVGQSNLQGTATIETNINPARIKTVRISSTTTKRILIKGFPLDPTAP